MNWHDVRRIVKSDYPKLLLILALAFYLAFIPHHNYPYLVHLDEWLSLAQSKAMLQAGSTTYIDPWYGLSTQSLSANPLIGSHLFWGIFHKISGISWLTIFKYFPGIIFMITILSVYVLARPQGFGWEAAFFTSLIPTTVGILGPGFLVPVAMGLPFIALCLFVAFNFRSWWCYVVLSIFMFFLFSLHVLTAAAVIIALAPYVLLNFRSDFKHSLGIALALALPFLAPFFWVFERLIPVLKGLFTPQFPYPFVELPRLIPLYGYLPIVFCLLGTFLLALRREKRNYGLIFGLLTLQVMLVSFFIFHYGLPIMYYRGLQYTMLIMSVVAGAGLMGVKSLRLPAKFTMRFQAPFFARNIGNLLCLILIGLTLAMCIPVRQSIPYYHMIDKEDYEAFVWVRENVNDNYEKAILDPWKGIAFVAIAEKNVYVFIAEHPGRHSEEAYDFLRGGCKDTTFLTENNMSIIYTRWEVNNPDLVEVRKNVYLLKEIQESE